MFIYIVINRARAAEQSHSRGVDSIWQTERRDVPRLLTLHLLCVCYFIQQKSDLMNGFFHFHPRKFAHKTKKQFFHIH